MTNLSEKKGGGLIYNPPRMLFDGSTGYYEDTSITVANNVLSCCGIFKVGTLADDQRIVSLKTTASSYIRLAVTVKENDHANAPSKLQFYAVDSTGTVICRVHTSTDVDDDRLHTFQFTYNATTGAASLILDGVADLDTGNPIHLLTTGTLTTGAAKVCIGSDTAEAAYTFKFGGEIGFLAYQDAEVTDWSPYFDQFDNPKQADFSGWLFGHFAGKMDENEGTAGAMTKNGTITLVDPGQAPHIGLPTIGTAEAWDIKTGKIAWVDGVEKVGSGYFPAMMEFDGSTGRYTATYTSSGNKVSVVAQFNRAAFADGSQEGFFRVDGPSGHQRIGLFVSANNHATTDYQGKLQMLVRNNSGTIICRLISSTNFLDGENHTVFAEFDGDAGTAVFRVDGNDEDDTGNASRTAPTTGTLDSGASSTVVVGALSFAGSLYWDGLVGFSGMRDVGGLTWSDFMQTDGSPKELDTSTWTEWGGTQPAFFHESAKMDENLGSAGAMTKNGTITLAAASSWS